MMNKGKLACSAVAVLLLLCAMTAARAAVAFRAATSTRQAATASGGTISVNKPAGTVSGDVLLASIAVVPNTSTVVTPTGWTIVQSINQTSDSTSRLYTFYRVAGGSEPGLYAWTFSGANSGAVAAVASFSGVDISSASPIIDASAAQTTSDAFFTHTAPSVTANVAGDMLVTVHEYASSRNWAPPTGMTERTDFYSDTNGGNTGVSMELNTESRSAAGATGPRTATVPSNKDSGATHAILLKAQVVAFTPGDFNSYDSSTPANAMDGVIMTKVAGSLFTLDIVALNTAKTAILSSFTGVVKVELLNAADNAAALDANGCRSGWTTIQTVSPNPTFVAANNGRRAVSFTENNAYRDVRVRVTYTASGTTKIGCSTDNFAIRPASFTGLTVSDADWQSAGTARVLNNIGASGGVVHKAGRPFRIDAVARNLTGTGIAYGAAAGNYNGLPQAQLISCVLPASCTPGTLDELGAASAWTAGASGSFYSATASYDDAGSFSMQLVDTTFAAVDGSGSDGTPADCSAGGQYVCSATVNVGRFVPDHFELVDASAADPLVDTAVDTWLPLAAPQFRTFNLTDAACNAAAPAPKRAFTYIGQPFGYVSVPQFTVKAMDAGDNPISNYPTLTKLAVTQSYSAASGTLDTSRALQTPTPTLNDNYTNSSGSPVVGRFAVNAADTLAFARNTPVAPFNAAISLSIAVQDSSENAVAGNGNITATAPVTFSAIAFDAGSEMRFGRLKLSNALGSELLNLPIQLQAQYWNGTGTAFVTNALDHCTAISANNVALGNYRKSLSATNMGTSHINPGAALLSGRGSLSLSKPAPAAGGSVDIALNLGTASADQSCLSWTPPAPASTGAGMAHLRGKWCGANQDRDPGARATFGVYKNANEFIYMREMY